MKCLGKNCEEEMMAIEVKPFLAPMADLKLGGKDCELFACTSVDCENCGRVFVCPIEPFEDAL